MCESRKHEYLNIGGVVDRSTKPTSKKKKHDPYAIYDDENAGTHYFLVPATKDPRNFTRAFQELNSMPISKTNLHAKLLNQQTDAHNSNTSGYINDKNFRNISSSTPPRRSRTKSCGSSSSSSSTPRLKIPPPPAATTISSQNTFPDFSTQTDDDYIFLKGDSKSTVQPPKSNQLLKREHFPEFAKILKKESMVHYSSSGTTTINTNCEKLSLKKKKDSLDSCTCSINYKYNGKNDDHECINSCSCQNSTKSIVGRYFCMGLRAVFFPCISCYVPAKACCGSNRKWKYKHSQDDTYVCYQSNNNKLV